MPRLRRLSGLCSSTLSVNCEYFTKDTQRKPDCRSPVFEAVTCRQSAPGYQRERGDSQEGGNRRCLPSCAPARRQRTPPPRGAANPLAEVQRKTLRPLGTNTLTQFAHPAQPVQRKRLPPGQGEPADAVRVPHLITARKCKKPPYGSYGGFSMSYLVCWVIINTGMYQIS